MRAILILAALASCGGGVEPAGPHVIEPCFQGTIRQCERACVDPPDNPSGSACAALYGPEEQPSQCDATFEFDGVRGCCQIFLGDDVGRFAECE